MLLVVLGAGASYDSASSRDPLNPDYSQMDHRPPLAAQLFSDRSSFVAVMAKYSQCLPIIPRLQRVAPGGSVEGELQRLQAEATEYPVRHQQLSAVRYYLQEMLWDCTRVWINSVHRITNFMTLVDDISRWKKPGEKVCFVTFNYDTMLEEALSHHMGVQFNELSSYISSKDFLLIKLHGSINWAREVRTDIPYIQNLNGPSVAKEVIQRSANLEISQLYSVIDKYPPPARTNFAMFPAIAIPVETKLDFECPSEHIDALKEFLPQASKILMIGWRATEAPFLDMLKQELRQRVLVIAVAGRKGGSAQAVQNIVSKGISAQYVPIEGGFTDFILSRQGEGFFK